MFDLHSVALIVPNIMWAVHLLDPDGFKRHWPVIVALLLTREDINRICCFIDTAILRGRTRAGLATIAVSTATTPTSPSRVASSRPILPRARAPVPKARQ